MAKKALLIGVSEYQPGLHALPAAQNDVQAIAKVLTHPEMGGFAASDVEQLVNPDAQQMREAIEMLFCDRSKEDLVVLYFSGHGVKDDNGKLHLTSRTTRKTPQGELVRSTAVEASFVQEIMSDSRSKRQVVILDCCYSGAFAEGWLAKDDGSVDIMTQLGGEGRAVLTSSTSTQYSFEQEGFQISTYTRYLVEGIETGTADQDEDDVVSVDELHEYAKKKVQEAAPAMKPEIYAVKEGYKIHLAKAPIGDPKLKYRKEVERCVHRGQISPARRNILDLLRENLGLQPEETAAIEAEVLKPYQHYEKKLQRYEQVLAEEIQREYPLSQQTLSDLKRLQEVLGLRNEDIAPVEERILPHKVAACYCEPVAEVKDEPSLSGDSDVTAKKALKEAGAATKAATLDPNSTEQNSNNDSPESCHKGLFQALINFDPRLGCQFQIVVAGITILSLSAGVMCLL